MSWTKVCDSLHGHPKAMDAGLEAMGLWVLALSHCGAYLTNGHVKRSAAARLAGERLEVLAAILVRVGLWELHPSGDGWQVHDYLGFNPSRDQVLADREKGKRRAAASYEKRSSGEERPKDQRSAPESSVSLHPTRPDPDPDPNQNQERAPAAPLALTVEPHVPVDTTRSAKKATKHTPEDIAAKDIIVAAFVERFEAVKSVKPKTIPAADHAAAFKLARTYGADEACSIIKRAFEDDFVVSKNTTLRYIASKADTFRGNAPPKTNDGWSKRHELTTQSQGGSWKSGVRRPASEPTKLAKPTVTLWCKAHGYRPCGCTDRIPDDQISSAAPPGPIPETDVAVDGEEIAR